MDPDRPDQDLEFWLRHVRFGVWLSLVLLAFTGPYLLLRTTEQRGLLLTVLVSTALLTVTVRLLPWPRMLRMRRPMWWFYAWSHTITAMITLAAAADGGIDSPLLIIYALPMLFAAIAYPPRAVIVIGLVMVAATGMLGAVIGVEAPGRAWMTLSVFALAAWTFGYAATNYRRSADQIRQLADQLAEQANVDGLTGCINHRAFQERLAVEVGRAHRTGEPLGLLMADVDHFKAINDTYGHQAGDRVLEQVAAALRADLRSVDEVARIGGEEFAVLLPGADTDRCVEVAERLRRVVGGLEEPTNVTISIGAAVLPDMAETASRLLQLADTALYAAKAGGRDAVALPHAVTDGMPAITGTRTRTVRSRVCELLDGDALHSVFQPIIDLDNGQVVAYEALARIRDSKLRPDQWLELAEQTGQRTELEGAMLDAALRCWEPFGLDVRLFVNLSPEAIAAGVPWPRMERMGHGVVVEVSERDPVENYGVLHSAIQDLQHHGLQLAIDDVGAGHANMRHVLELEPAFVKIDRSLVQDIDERPRQASLMRAIARFTADIGVRVIGEGIERPGEGSLLHALDVNYGQGYLIARPAAVPPAPAWPPHAADRAIPTTVAYRRTTGALALSHASDPSQ